ncbi:AAA family ATPase [Herbiconiux sp. CPCC 205763]|uniref:AAA family ATPase n=1 Tax=Herbiconiux aconitum TaxID=2970913 RepID=A0ABT2GRA4_9MICO|nr:helix-turn-helix transcriptional regulator [Herbiconiux aconitum]MCS5718753.1 AAA family ATPase [Herbiconiux aconitum]
MLDRHPQRTQLDALLRSIREGRSSILLLDGGAGIGKTTLLDYVAKRAHDIELLSVTGIQSEVELAYAALHQLCRPLEQSMSALPAPQREALEITFGQREGDAPNKFLVGLAALGLLSEASRSTPILCLVDDAQWLDEASAQVLGFVARRLGFEPVGMVFALRAPSSTALFDGVPPITVEAFERHDAETLLSSLVPGPIDPRAMERVLDEADGNPLAIVESARELSRAEISTGMILPATTASPSRMEEHYQRLLGALPDDTQRLLLVAAAEPTAQSHIIFAAASTLGVQASALQPAIAAGLAHPPMRFSHPLVRSAVYRAATPDAVRAAHAALATTITGDADPDLLAWHRARAAPDTDDDAAADLAAAAARLQARGGTAAAAALLHQAVQVSSDDVRKAEWLLRIAQAELAAGQYDLATRDIAAAAGCLPERLLAESKLTEARIAFARDRGGASVSLLLDAAEHLAPDDPDGAREAYLEALSAAMFGASLAETGARRVAERWLAAEPTPGSRPAHLLLDAMTRVLTDDDPSAKRNLQEALAPFSGEIDDERTHIHWMWHATISALAAWDFTTWDAVSLRHLGYAREAGDYSELPIALTTRAYAHLFRGESSAAVEAVREMQTIAAVTGSRMAPTAAIGVAAVEGSDSELDKLVRATIADSEGRADGSGLAIAYWGAAVLNNSRGHFDRALEWARLAGGQSNPLHSATNWALAEAIEAASRVKGADASSELAQLESATAGYGTDWARGVYARSKALLSSGADAESGYLEAINLLERTPSRLDLARATLVYGEWLRRQRRRPDARIHLLRAHQVFADMGATAFALRAQQELHALGILTGARRADAGSGLTSQESQIAQLVGQGLTNSEVASRMFLSSRTVEYHLAKVFTKLQITSRHQLSGPTDRDLIGPTGI